jgi:enterochelin esterase-like enzyme
MPLLAALATAALLPGFTLVTTGPNGGTVLSGPLPGTDRPAYVYLPPGFTTARRYPVVYLLHGLPGSPSEFVSGAGLLSFADASVKPFIAIMPAAGPRHRYNGEWAGPWEHALVRDVVPWVDENLPTIAAPTGRVLAGISAGGFGAADIGLRNSGIFGTIESWSGYFAPLQDGPFKDASRAVLAANDPRLLARTDATRLRRNGVRFFLSTGPSHSHWFKPAQTVDFAHELARLGVTVKLLLVHATKGEYVAQLTAGLAWGLSD